MQVGWLAGHQPLAKTQEVSLKPGSSSFSSPAAFAPFRQFSAQFAECHTLLWVHTGLLGYWQKIFQQPPDLRACWAALWRTHVLLYPPLPVLAWSPPSSWHCWATPWSFFGGSSFSLHQGWVQRQADSPSPCARGAQWVRGAMGGSDTPLGWGHSWEMKHPCLSNVRSWCLRVQPVLGIATPAKFDSQGCYGFFSSVQRSSCPSVSHRTRRRK